MQQQRADNRPANGGHADSLAPPRKHDHRQNKAQAERRKKASVGDSGSGDKRAKNANADQRTEDASDQALALDARNFWRHGHGVVGPTAGLVSALAEFD